MIVGVDVGKSGGLAAIADGETYTLAMPFIGKDLDVQAIVDWVHGICEPDCIYLEEQTANAFHGLPKPALAAFSQGGQFEALKATAKLMAWPLVVVPPKRWQATYAINVTKRPGESQTAYSKRKKARHVEVATRLYPRANLLPTTKSRVPSDGLADALLIAHYGLTQ